MALGMLFLMVFTALIAAAVWLMISGRSRQDHPSCGHCGYDLTASQANRCPECGQLFIEAGVRPAGPGRSGARTWTGVTLLVIAVLLLPCTVSTGMYFVARRRATAAQIAAQRARIAVAQQAYRQSLPPFQAGAQTPGDSGAAPAGAVDDSR